MPTYVVTGRVLPERTNFVWPKMDLRAQIDQHEITISAAVLLSNIVLHYVSPVELDPADLRNLSFRIAGDIVNVAGFFQNRAFSYDIELLTCTETGHTEVFGVEGYAFHDGAQLRAGITFNRAPDGTHISVPTKLYGDAPFTRATFELRSAIRYPEYTALHCRLAIESIRNGFDKHDEARGWGLLRKHLNVQRTTIDSFRAVATDQRHGRNFPQTWEQRRDCMQIAWEIVYRYAQYVDNEYRPNKDLPSL